MRSMCCGWKMKLLKRCGRIWSVGHLTTRWECLKQKSHWKATDHHPLLGIQMHSMKEFPVSTACWTLLEMNVWGPHSATLRMVCKERPTMALESSISRKKIMELYTNGHPWNIFKQQQKIGLLKQLCWMTTLQMIMLWWPLFLQEIAHHPSKVVNTTIHVLQASKWWGSSLQFGFAQTSGSMSTTLKSAVLAVGFLISLGIRWNISYLFTDWRCTLSRVL